MSTPNEDIYGQIIPNETPDLISSSLKKLDEELQLIPDADKEAYSKANEKCPEFMTDEFKLLFLRCEIFDATLAAKRITKYWQKRIELFKEPNAFKPLKLGPDGAFTNEHDNEALKSDLMRIPGTTDSTDRPIVFFDPSKGPYKGTYDKESYIRAFWYFIHAVLEDPIAQKKGIILLGYGENANFGQFDRDRSKMMIESMKGCLPLRISAFHICHPPTFVNIIFPIIKLIMGQKLRKKLKVHSGSKEKVLEKLVTKYKIEKSSLPSDVGGDLVLDHAKWLEDRKKSNL